MLNYYSRYNRIKIPRDIISLSTLVSKEEARASSNDELHQTSRSRSRESNGRNNRSLEEEFSPIKNYRKQESECQIEEEYHQVLGIILKRQQGMHERHQIFIEHGHDITPVTSEAHYQFHERISKPLRYSKQQYNQQSSNVEGDSEIVVLPQNQEFRVFDQQFNMKMVGKRDVRFNDEEFRLQSLRRPYSQPNWGEVQNKSDSLQDVYDYKEYAAKCKTNRVHSPNMRRSEMERSRSEKFKQNNLSNKIIDEIDIGQEDEKAVERKRLQQNKQLPQPSHNDQREINQLERQVSKEDENMETGRFFGTTYGQSAQNLKTVSFRDQIQEEIDLQQCRQEKEECEPSNQNSSGLINDSPRRLTKARFNPLRGPIIYQSQIQSDNSLLTASKLFNESGKKPTFKEMLKMRQLNPRMVTSTILVQKNMFGEEGPAKVNFKNLIKANFNAIISMHEQKQKQKEQMKESSDSKQPKSNTSDKNRHLLRAFFDQN